MYTDNEKTAIAILDILQKHRRIKNEHKDGDFSIVPFIKLVLPFVEKKLPFKMLLSAFHCKSINHNSVLSNFPDAAEQESIEHLQEICKEIEKVYPPGCELLIVHEGHFYTDIKITSDDKIIEEYENLTHRMANIPAIKFTNIIKDYFSEDYDVGRKIIFEKYMDSLESVKKMIKEIPEIHDKYVAYKAFSVHEFAPVLMPNEGKGKIKKWSREISYLWIQRYLVFKKLCKELFGDYFPLSVLSYGSKSQRFSINLIPGSTHIGMPWFHVLVKKIDGGIDLIKKNIAVENEFKLVNVNHKPWYYKETKK